VYIHDKREVAIFGVIYFIKSILVKISYVNSHVDEYVGLIIFILPNQGFVLW
jgi:hypothetical protein